MGTWWRPGATGEGHRAAARRVPEGAGQVSRRGQGEIAGAGGEGEKMQWSRGSVLGAGLK